MEHANGKAGILTELIEAKILPADAREVKIVSQLHDVDRLCWTVGGNQYQKPLHELVEATAGVGWEAKRDVDLGLEA